MTADQKAVVTFKNLPQMDSVGILLGKVDAETNQNKPQGSATLQEMCIRDRYMTELAESGDEYGCYYLGKEYVRKESPYSVSYTHLDVYKRQDGKRTWDES